MTHQPLDIVMLGLSVTSSWGNGHATTYRGLIRGLSARGHRILFLERDVPWYRENRDQPSIPGARIELYESLAELMARFENKVRKAGLVIVGSFVPEGIAIGHWVTSIANGITAFYDIDTPVTLSQLESGACDFLSVALIPRYRLYLSFTGGPTLRRIEQHYGSPMARRLYCSVDPSHYFPARTKRKWSVGYLGTYCEDRQPMVDELLVQPARDFPERRFVVAGPLYPENMEWPANVDRIFHLPPAEHSSFYASQRFTLNITRAPMVAAGYSPSVRLFEAGACGVPIISDNWLGLDSLLEPGREILLAESAADVRRYLTDLSDEACWTIGARARERILAEHTPRKRALELEGYYHEARGAFYLSRSVYAAPSNGGRRRFPAAVTGNVVESAQQTSGDEVRQAASSRTSASDQPQEANAGCRDRGSA